MPNERRRRGSFHNTWSYYFLRVDLCLIYFFVVYLNSILLLSVIINACKNQGAILILLCKETKQTDAGAPGSSTWRTSVRSARLLQAGPADGRGPPRSSGPTDRREAPPPASVPHQIFSSSSYPLRRVRVANRKARGGSLRCCLQGWARHAVLPRRRGSRAPRDVAIACVGTKRGGGSVSSVCVVKGLSLILN